MKQEARSIIVVISAVLSVKANAEYSPALLFDMESCCFMNLGLRSSLVISVFGV